MIVQGDVHGDVTVAGRGGKAASGASAIAESGGAAAAGGSAAATHGGGAATDRSTVVKDEHKAGFVERAKTSTRVKICGCLMVLAVIAATLLLVVGGETELGIAGYIVAAAAVLVGVVPLFFG